MNGRAKPLWRIRAGLGTAPGVLNAMRRLRALPSAQVQKGIGAALTSKPEGRPSART